MSYVQGDFATICMKVLSFKVELSCWQGACFFGKVQLFKILETVYAKELFSIFFFFFCTNVSWMDELFSSKD